MIKRERIKKSFDKAAYTYEMWADIQHYAASELIKMIPGHEFEHVLEIGCGTGYLTDLLVKKPFFNNIISTDISLPMIKKNKSKKKGIDKISFIATDASSLSCLLNTKFDLIISNSALHWLMDDFTASLESMFDILAPEGLFSASVFTNNGLIELKTALKEFTSKEVELPVNSFPDYRLIENFAQNHLMKYEIKRVKTEKSYKDMISLMRALHRTGVAPYSNRHPVIFSRSGMKDMERIFYDLYGNIKLTYEIIFFSGMKPSA